MKFYLLILVVLLGTESQASDLASAPDCVITDGGRVYLVSSYRYTLSEKQQMVYFVGTETWKNPEQARNQCNFLRREYTDFIGEKWMQKHCGCFGKSIRERVIAYGNDSGDEILFYAHNQLDFRDALDNNPVFELVTPNDPACNADPDPMCGH